MKKKKEKITLTRIEYDLIEVYRTIEIDINELEDLSKIEDEDELYEELNDRFYESDRIIYYAGDDNNDYGKIIPHNENSHPMGDITLIDDMCIDFNINNDILIGKKQTKIHDFSNTIDGDIKSYLRNRKLNNLLNEKL